MRIVRGWWWIFPFFFPGRNNLSPRRAWFWNRTTYIYISFPSPSPWRFSGTKRENKLAKRANAGRPFFVINYGCRSGNILVYIQRPRRKTAASARQKQTGFGGGWRLVENSPCRPLNYAGHTSNVLVAVDIHCLLFSTSSASSFPSYFLPLSISFRVSLPSRRFLFFNRASFLLAVTVCCFFLF